MYSRLNAAIGKVGGAQFVTPVELAEVVEGSCSTPEIVQDDPDFTVLAVDHPDRGKLFTVCSVAGANMVLSSA